MKKHPVDDLFAKKLSNWEPKASPDLWKRIEAKQQKAPRRLGNWYWFAAAGISLTLISGYLVWQGESSHPIDRGNSIVQNEPQNIQQEQQEEVKVPAENAELLAKNDNGLLTEKNKVQPLPGNQKKTMLRVNREVVPSIGETAPVLSNVEVAAIRKEEIAPEPLPVDEELIAIPNPVEMPATTKSVDEPSKTRVIVAHVQVEEQDEQKSSKFIRILRQLKNAKQGEAVDWDEVGFNPKKLMARADERLRNEEDKLSKQYQNLKEKTKL